MIKKAIKKVADISKKTTSRVKRTVAKIKEKESNQEVKELLNEVLDQSAESARLLDGDFEVKGGRVIPKEDNRGVVM